MNLVAMDASPAERLDKIFVYICTYKDVSIPVRYGISGPVVDLSASYMFRHASFFGLAAKDEMKFYLNQLIEIGLLKMENPQTTTIPNYNGSQIHYPSHAVIPYKGMQYLHEIENRSQYSTTCFVAMEFDDKKQIRIDAINAACKKFGFNAFTVDEHHEGGNNTIDAKIILAIKGSKFCIVDFTGANQGAYMEAGYAMGRDKKVIFICEEGDFDKNKKHFDVNHYPFLRYTSIPDLTAKLESEIGAYIDIEKRTAPSLNT
jgi:hypothetical protein